MECEWDRDLKRVQAHSSIVVAHVEEEGLLVGQVIVRVQLTVHQFCLASMLPQVGRELGLFPRGPHKVSTTLLLRLLTTTLFNLAEAVIAAIVDVLSDESFFAFSVPPRPSFKNVTHCLVVVPSAHVELEVIGATFRLSIPVFLVQYTVHLLHKLYIDSVQKIGFL